MQDYTALNNKLILHITLPPFSVISKILALECHHTPRPNAPNNHHKPLYISKKNGSICGLRALYFIFI